MPGFQPSGFITPAFLACLIAAVLSACSTLETETVVRPSRVSVMGETAEPPAESAEISALRADLAANAAGLVGMTGDSITVNGRTYTIDCTGTVLAVYAMSGIELDREFNRYSGNGVERLYRTMLDSELVYEPPIPVPGDLVFWDNTYDRNGNGEWDDLYTHVGMVVEVRPDGIVSYVHHNYAKGIVVEYMNLLREDTYEDVVDGESVIFNSPMRMKSHRYLRPDKWLSSHLYKASAKGYLFE